MKIHTHTSMIPSLTPHLVHQHFLSDICLSSNTVEFAFILKSRCVQIFATNNLEVKEWQQFQLRRIVENRCNYNLEEVSLTKRARDVKFPQDKHSKFIMCPFDFPVYCSG